MEEYRINHAAHGCYEVILIKYNNGEKKCEYLTNFRNKKAAMAFVEAHRLNEVAIDLDTRIPTPDFR